jgi:hypothetical protein
LDEAVSPAARIARICTAAEFLCATLSRCESCCWEIHRSFFPLKLRDLIVGYNTVFKKHFHQGAGKMFRIIYPADIAHKIERRWQRRFGMSGNNVRLKTECCTACGGVLITAAYLLAANGARPSFDRSCVCNRDPG